MALPKVKSASRIPRGDIMREIREQGDAFTCDVPSRVEAYQVVRSSSSDRSTCAN